LLYVLTLDAWRAAAVVTVDVVVRLPFPVIVTVIIVVVVLFLFCGRNVVEAACVLIDAVVQKIGGGVEQVGR
jgi:hypothetical protein